MIGGDEYGDRLPTLSTLARWWWFYCIGSWCIGGALLCWLVL